ncbi:hypothetical protein [Mesobacillus foraminis]|uniref:hypothetical protein n=1 Tax=Mesobacillus foraminis TaxID=279826 RepID=UPI000EF4BC63|nr:hypothetical protein [Mesobacillus foraminis]
MVQTILKFALFCLLLLGVIELTINEFFKNDDAVTVTSFKSEDEMNQENIPSLEMHLVGQDEVSGYIVETYREYEVYKNDSGEVVKEVPTANFDYIRYKIE